MRVSKKILIEESDVSGLHSELSDIVNFFIENSVGGTDDGWVKKEFPGVVKLQRLLSSVVIEEPGMQIYDRLNQQSKNQETNRISSRLRVVGKDKNA